MNNKGDKTNIAFDIADAINAVRIYYPEFEEQKMKIRTRRGQIREPRQIVQFLLLPHHSLKFIGQSTGGFDHSTVINSRQVVSDRMDVDRYFKRQMETMIGEFNKSRHLRLFGLHESGEQFLQPETWIPNAPADNIAFAYL